MHSFEVNIRICQPENRDDHLGEKNAPIVLLYDTVSLFLVIKEVFFSYLYIDSSQTYLLHVYKIISTTAFQVSETLIRCAKELHFIKITVLIK